MKVRLLASALLLFFAVSGYGQATTVLQLQMVTGNPLEPTVTNVNPNIPLDVGSNPVAKSLNIGRIAVLNTDSKPHTLTNVTVATGTDFSLDTTFPFTGPVVLQPGVPVLIDPSLIFLPSAAGPRTGQISLFDDEPGSPQKYALTGTGYTDFGMICDNGGQSLFSIDFYCSHELHAGQIGDYFLQLSSVNSFSGQVSMSCSGLPQGTSCAFAPAAFSFTAPQSFQNITLTVKTTAQAASLPPGSGPIWWAFVGLIAITLTSWRKRPRRRLLAGLAFAVFLLSCGGGGTPLNSGPPGSTPSGTFPFTFTATANGVSHSKTLTLVVK